MIKTNAMAKKEYGVHIDVKWPVNISVKGKNREEAINKAWKEFVFNISEYREAFELLAYEKSS